MTSNHFKRLSNQDSEETNKGDSIPQKKATHTKLDAKLGGLKFKANMEKVSAKEHIAWLKGFETCPLTQDMYGWGNVGRSDANLSAEAYWFCYQGIFDDISVARAVFDNLEGMELVKVRFRANPFERVKGVFSVHRSAMKMANIDAVFGYMFTNPKDKDGNNLLDDTKLLFFADVCGGPGGFSEYILWRKKWRAKGFGITLKGDNDFKLDSFLEAPPESLELHYGSKGNGDICDPENIKTFCRHVLAATEDGVHFTMADGGTSDEGQETKQEIQLKRLFLCQCLIALRITRPGGHFVMKLFNLLTPFCVGLVYLMHTCFRRICIHKPNTCLPASSERYLICESKLENVDCMTVAVYLDRINKRMMEIEGTNLEIIDLVPRKHLTEEGSKFYKYIIISNNTLGKRQLTALLKIAAFSKNPSLIDDKQNQMKEECLALYGIDKKPPTTPTVLDPAAVLADVVENSTDKIGKTLDRTLMPKLKHTQNWKYRFLRSKNGELVLEPTLFYSQGGSKLLRLNDENQWVDLPDNQVIQLPRDTLILGFLMCELAEPDFENTATVLYIIDAARLAGEDVKDKPLETRKQLCKMFAKAVKRIGNEVFHTEFKPLAGLENDFNKLSAYNNFLGHAFSKIRDGVLFIPSCKYPWVECFSRTQNRPYYFNVLGGASSFDFPVEAECDFNTVLKNMAIWRWNDSSLQPKEFFDFIKVESTIIDVTRSALKRKLVNL